MPVSFFSSLYLQFFIKSYVNLYFFMACILFLPDTALAGAWPLSEGKTQTIQTMSFQQMKKRVPPSVILRPAGFGKSVSKTLPVYSTSTVLECALWAEVGLTSRLTAIAELSHKRFIFDDAMSKTDATRLRSFETGLRYTFWYPSQSSALSLQASLLSPSVADGLPYDDFDQDRGGFDLRLLGGLSFSLAGRSGFFDIQAAHRHYTNRYQENRIQLTLGLDVK